MGSFLFLLALVACVVAYEPLYLSNYLNNPSLGRSLAQVNGLPSFVKGPSYSGYITLSPGRYTFFWYFQNPNPNAPVATWLQGGPGASSMFGLFTEHGPFSVSANGTTLVERQPYAWTNAFSMIYIDNPVGVGYSFTTLPDGYVKSQADYGQDLYNFIQQFFVFFPDQLKNPFWICGESYGGKYVPAFGYTLANAIAAGKSNINFKGVLIGDGALDPRTQFTDYSNLMYYFGFASENERQYIRSQEQLIGRMIDNGDFKGAFLVFDALLNGDFYPYPTYFSNITGLKDYFNLLSPTYPPNPYPTFLGLDSTKQMLHVGSANTYWDYNATVERNLIDDWMQGVLPKLQVIVNNYTALVYNGQLDVILGVPLAQEALNKFQWTGSELFRRAKKQVWTIPGGDVGGYIIQALPNNVTGLTFAAIRKAGHMCPTDNAPATYDLVTRFILGKGFQ